MFQTSAGVWIYRACRLLLYKKNLPPATVSPRIPTQELLRTESSQTPTRSLMDLNVASAGQEGDNDELSQTNEKRGSFSFIPKGLSNQVFFLPVLVCLGGDERQSEGLTQQPFINHSLEPGSPSTRCQQGPFFLRPLSWLAGDSLLCVLLRFPLRGCPCPNLLFL